MHLNIDETTLHGVRTYPQLEVRSTTSQPEATISKVPAQHSTEPPTGRTS